jgi:hypothetical protein
MSLASNAHTAAPVFNANFYITAATLIPVLFIAIALQSRQGYRRLLGLTENLASRKYRAVRESQQPLRSRLPDAGIGIVAALLVAILYGIVIAGGLGEELAVFALYQEHDDSSTRVRSSWQSYS